jgi:Arc/MetJ-type ribon-helix-helix transcriptional regulator
MSGPKQKAARRRRGPKPRGLVKKTITMSKTREVAIERAVAEGRAPSASSYIEKALDAFATLESYDALLADWRLEVGPATPDERAWARDEVRRAMAGSERKVG